LARIAFNLIQIEGNPRPAQAGDSAVALNRVNPIERNTLKNFNPLARRKQSAVQPTQT
jgi:hypothetical protein